MNELSRITSCVTRRWFGSIKKRDFKKQHVKHQVGLTNLFHFAVYKEPVPVGQKCAGLGDDFVFARQTNKFARFGEMGQIAGCELFRSVNHCPDVVEITTFDYCLSAFLKIRKYFPIKSRFGQGLQALFKTEDSVVAFTLYHTPQVLGCIDIKSDAVIYGHLDFSFVYHTRKDGMTNKMKLVMRKE